VTPPSRRRVAPSTTRGIAPEAERRGPAGRPLDAQPPALARRREIEDAHALVALPRLERHQRWLGSQASGPPQGHNASGPVEADGDCPPRRQRDGDAVERDPDVACARRHGRDDVERERGPLVLEAEPQEAGSLIHRQV
jgi:hypothetical protein